MDKVHSAISRRGLLGAAIATVAAAPAMMSTTKADAAPSPTTSTTRNVKDFGAKGDGTTDDTDAFVKACAGVSGRLVLYIPAGGYRLRSMPELPDYATILGDGGDLSVLMADHTGTFITLRNKSRIGFKQLGIWILNEVATAVRVSQSFRCSFNSVVIRGNHSGDNFPRYSKQRGVLLDNNSGGTAFINCDIDNCGIGLETQCIQNYITSSKFSFNHTSVLAAGPDFAPGLAMLNVEFVSDRDPRTTDTHLLIDGPANDWWLTNIWFEGCATAISVGNTKGGPSQFSLVNAKVAARDTCIDIIFCREPYIANVILDKDSPANRPTELRIDKSRCPDGTAINLISSTDFDLSPDIFPTTWTYIGRGQDLGPTFATQVVMQHDGDRDPLVFTNDSNSTTARVTSSGAFVAESAATGMVLRGRNRHYYRLTVSDSGVVGTRDLGPRRPR